METEAIRPIFEKYGLADILPLIQHYVDYSKNKYRMFGYDIHFQESFDVLSCYEKHLLIEAVTNKYKDFDSVIVSRTYNQMCVNFQESGKCKVRNICNIEFKLLENNNNFIKFRGILVAYGRKTLYYQAMGNFNVILK
jgi:hypothetical protein